MKTTNTMIIITNFYAICILLFLFYHFAIFASSENDKKTSSNKKSKSKSVIRHVTTKRYKNRKYKDKILSKEEFKGKFKELGWFINPFYATQVWDEYEQNEKYRQVLNRYLLSNGKRYLRNYIEDSFGEVFKHKQNVTIHVYGKKGMGKSFIARGFAHKMCKELGKNPDYHLDFKHLDDHKSYILNEEQEDYHNIFQTYNFSQSKYIFKRMQEHEILIQDEMPEDRGKGAKNVLKDVHNSLKIFTRANLINLIFLNTSMIKMNDIDLFVEALAINENKGLNLCVLSVLSKDKKRIVYEGVAILKLREPAELTKWYEETSRRMKTRVQEKGGKSGVERLEKKEDLEFLINFMKESGKTFKSKGAFRSFVFDQPELDRIDDSLFTNEIIDSAWEILNGGTVSFTTKKIDTDEELGKVLTNDGEKFTFDIEELYNLYISDTDVIAEKAKREKRVKMHRDYSSFKKVGLTQDDLISKYTNELGGTMTQSAFSKQLSRINGWLNDAIGKLYEKHLALQLMKKYEGKYEKILYWGNTKGTERELGGHGEPDILIYWKDDYRGGNLPPIPGRVWVISVKCYCPGESRKSTSIPIGKIKAEVQECQRIHDFERDKNPALKFVYYNRNGNPEQIESLWKDYDWTHLPSSISVELIREGKSRVYT